MATSEQIQPLGNDTAGLPCVPGDHTVLAALLHDRDAFVEAPIPHLDDLHAAAGLEQRGHLLAAVGFVGTRTAYAGNATGCTCSTVSTSLGSTC